MTTVSPHGEVMPPDNRLLASRLYRLVRFLQLDGPEELIANEIKLVRTSAQQFHSSIQLEIEVTPVKPEDQPLLPCPFCGSPGIIEILPTKQYHPRCTGQSGKFCLLGRKPDPDKDGFTYKIDAVESWNRRAGE